MVPFIVLSVPNKINGGVYLNDADPRPTMYGTRVRFNGGHGCELWFGYITGTTIGVWARTDGTGWVQLH